MLSSNKSNKKEFVDIVQYIDQIYDAILAYVVGGEQKIREKYNNAHMADLCQKMGGKIASVVLYCKTLLSQEQAKSKTEFVRRFSQLKNVDDAIALVGRHDTQKGNEGKPLAE